jgi:hypothetical protein
MMLHAFTQGQTSRRFSARLSFPAARRPFATLYELTPNGEYLQLSYYWARASYVGDRSHRRLLTPNKLQQLAFGSGRLTSREFRPGSRLVVVLGVIKQTGEQINYGTGKDVSDETIADGKKALQIKWYGDSFIDIPVRR